MAIPERGNSGLKLIQNNPEERFLALTVRDGKGYKSIEYFFDTEGNISGYLIVPRANSLNNIDVGLTSDIKVIYNISRPIDGGLHPLRPNEISVFLISSKEDLMDPELEEMLGNFVLRGISRQKLDVVDKDKKQVFEIESGEESDKEGHRGRSLFISQKHTPTGIIKILRAPLRIDLQKIAEILNSKPPYNKEKVGEKERLVVP